MILLSQPEFRVHDMKPHLLAYSLVSLSHDVTLHMIMKVMNGTCKVTVRSGRRNSGLSGF